MYPIDPYHYFLEGVVTDVLENVPIVCNSKELLHVPLNPFFSNCGGYFNEFFSSGATGYLVDSNATSVCEYCPMRYIISFFFLLFCFLVLILF